MPRRRIRKPAEDSPTETIREQARALRQKMGLDYLYAPRGLMASALEEFSAAQQGRIPPSDMLTPETLKYIAERSKTFRAIMARRSQQVTQFARRPLFDGDTGFEVVLKDQRRTPSDAEQAEARRIEDILLHTGSVYNPRRKDNLRIALQKLLYSTFVYDAMVVEPVIDGKGELLEWWTLDGGSVQMVNPDVWMPATELGKLSAPIQYVQVEHEDIKAEWSADELIYVVRNPSPDLSRYGYGQPELEILIDVITIEIEILTWAKMTLMNSSIPAGLLLVKSNRKDAPVVSPFGSGQTVEDMVRQWRNEASGVQNAGRLAMLRIPQGDDADFIDTKDKDRDMPFQSLYELVQNIICSIMGMLPAELAIVEGALKESSFVDSDAKASQLRYSRLTGLVYILGALAEVLNQIIERINPNYCILWRGVDWTSEMERVNLEASMLDNGIITWNEVRAMHNLPLFKGKWWADVPAVAALLNLEGQHRGWIQKGGVGGPAGGSPTQRKAKPGISGKPGSRRPGRAPEPNAD